MTPNPMDALGPPPFRFEPSRPDQSSDAFTRAFKTLATLMVGGSTVWMALLWSDGAFHTGGQGSGVGWFAAGLALMALTWWYIMSSRTRLTPTELHQSWIWDKRMELRELAYGKLIRVRGLDWLIAPRLYVRTLLGKFAVFYAADPVMIADFERLVTELRRFRQGP